MRRFPLVQAALICVGVRGIACAGLGTVTGARGAFVAYVVETGIIVSGALIIRDRRT